jgi:tetratricopeptide (TPR) repeat protein
MLWLFVGLLGVASAANAEHERGVELYKQQKYAEAIGALEQAAQSENAGSVEFKESALLIGQSYFMLAQAPKAIPWLEKVPGVNEANYMLGYAYLQTKQRANSEGAFARLFALKPESAAAHLVAGQMMLRKEYEEDAAQEVELALKLDPKLPEAHFLLGEMHIYRGRLDEGISDMQEELAVNPNFAMAWYRLGDAYTRKQNWTEAISNLERSVWLNPNYSGPYILLGKCYLNTGKLADGERILRSALALDPNNREATYLLGKTLAGEGKNDEAKSILEKLRSKDQ